MKILSVVGARPNFMKIGPFIRAISAYNATRNGNAAIEHVLVHTGQHYDDRMSKAFFAELSIPEADINLEVGSGSHAEQIGRTMIEFEKVVRAERPDWIVVVGDVNATCACSIVAKKEHVPLAHIEAGLRSGDITMPEEVNRLVTDRLSDLLFTPDEISSGNLRAEGVPDEKIRMVGNIMIDTLEHERVKVEKIEVADVLRRNVLDEERAGDLSEPELGRLAVVTLHRPSNVDDPAVLGPLVDFLANEVGRDMPVVWPIHPRTRKQLAMFGMWDELCRRPAVMLLQPVGYHDMLRLNMAARVVLTDSGGLQEECCVLGTPCLTMRRNTERPITLREHGGASTLVGNDVNAIRAEFRVAMASERRPTRPNLWDGHTAERIVRLLARTA
jgi:UDP-N-acetylglucosamine 2-epimerase (non-hydrolysing)